MKKLLKSKATTAIPRAAALEARMAYAILRTAKLKSFGEIGGSLSHNYRTRPTPNADPELTKKNWHSVKNSSDAMTAIKNRLPDNLRKNGVLCIEHLITASPEWGGWATDQEKEFFKKSVDWLKKKYGSKNVIATSIHRDETTPHLVAYVVPLDDSGRLNARRWLGGRKLMSEMQTAFAEQVKSLGLERGLEGSKVEHTTVKNYYAAIQKPVPAIKTSKILKIERLKEQPKYHFLDAKSFHGERVMNAVYENVEQQIDAFNSDVKITFSEMQLNYEKKLSAEKHRADKFEKAHELAIYENQKLRKEYASVAEYKRLFPKDFEKLENNIREEISDYQNKIEQEKYRQNYADEMRRKQQNENAQRKEQDFKNNISIKRKKRLEAQYSDFMVSISKCISESEKLALTQIYNERNAVLRSSPIGVMNEVLKTDNSNYYSKLCLSLFQVKTANDFKYALDDCIQFFESTAPLYDQGQGVLDSTVTRKVCAASINHLDNLLVKFGSSFSDQTEILQKYLLDCEKVSEQNSFKYLLDEKILEEQHKNYVAEKPNFVKKESVQEKRKDDFNFDR